MSEQQNSTVTYVPPKWNPDKESFNTFLENLQIDFEIYQIHEEKRQVLFLVRALPAWVYDILRTASPDKSLTCYKYQELVSELQTRFLSRTSLLRRQIQLVNRKQRINESISQYYDALQSLAKASQLGDSRDLVIRMVFLAGLKDDHIRQDVVTRTDYLNLVQIVAYAHIRETEKNLMQMSLNKRRDSGTLYNMLLIYLLVVVIVACADIRHYLLKYLQ